MEIPELESTVTEMKNSLEGLNNRLELAKKSANLEIDWWDLQSEEICNLKKRKKEK